MSPLSRLSVVLLAASALLPVAAEEVNLYSARQEALIKPLLDRFSEQTGIKVNLVTGNADALLSRLQQEGQNSPADLFVTTDAGRLWRAQQAGVLQPLRSELLESAIPAQYREDQGYWFGLTMRARPILYSLERVKPEALSTYADLADPKWKKRVCMRSSDNIYNQSHLAAMIAVHGEEATESWVRGLVANFARPPQGGDRDQIKAVAAGQCDVALVNTYYYGTMLAEGDEAEKAAAKASAIFWPDQAGRGAHVNISGAGLTASARNRDNAIRLLEFMAGDEAQSWYAEVNHEYPVKPGVAVSATLKALGEFKADDLNLDLLGLHNPDAVKLADRAGWK
jgi:iron(III) transport system substrate-binding protein